MPGPLDRLSGAIHSSSFNIGHHSGDKNKSPARRSSDGQLQFDKPRNNSLPATAMENLKRNSIVGTLGLTTKKDKGKKKDKDRGLHNSLPDLPPKPTNHIEIKVESPPNIFYGNPNSSTGALFSGMIHLAVVDPEIVVDSFIMELQAIVTSTHPVVKNCVDCAKQTTVLYTWTFVRETKRMLAGDHNFPFSYLLPGNLPATTQGRYGVLEYQLFAKATTQSTRPSTPVSSPLASPAMSPVTPVSSVSATFPPTLRENALVLRKPVEISRAIAPLPEKNSLRIFPPTNLTSHVTYSPIIHPIGDNNVYMRVNGTTTWIKDYQNRWRLRRLTWWLEEKEVMLSPACQKHAARNSGEKRGQKHEEIRMIGNQRLEEGWKTDLSEGTIEFEFSYRPKATPRPICDVESPTGLSITHSLVIELVIDEWFAPNKAPLRASPTGAARVLRMNFVVMVTERSGMGISWDEEQPPVYEDVPPSPPMYAADTVPRDTSAVIRDYTGPPLGDPPAHIMEEEMEGFDPNEPPRGAARQEEHRAFIRHHASLSGEGDYPVDVTPHIPSLRLHVDDFDTEEQESWARRQNEDAEDENAQQEEDVQTGSAG